MVRKIISSFLIITMLLISISWSAVVSAQVQQIPLSFYDSSMQIASDSGGTYSTDYPLDGDFKTCCKLKASTDGTYYTIMLGNGENDYELTEIILWQGSGVSNTYKERYNTVWTSVDGITFTKAANYVYTGPSGWTNSAETGNETRAKHTYTFSGNEKVRYVRIGNELLSDNELAIYELCSFFCSIAII